MSPALEAQSLNHWTTREILRELSKWTDVVRVEDGKFIELYIFNGYIWLKLYLNMKREKQLTAAGFDGVKGLARLYKGGLIL